MILNRINIWVLGSNPQLRRESFIVRWRKYRQLKKAGCSKRQIKALMVPGAPVLWNKDENGVLYPLDGRRLNRGEHWFSRMCKNGIWKKIGSN